MTVKERELPSAIQAISNANTNGLASYDEIASKVTGTFGAEMESLKNQGYVEQITLELFRVRV